MTKCVQMRSEQWKQSGGDTVGQLGLLFRAERSDLTNKVPGESQVLARARSGSRRTGEDDLPGGDKGG